MILELRPAAQEFLLSRSLTRKTFVGEVIYEDRAQFTHAVFPHEGVISLMAEMEDGRTIEKTSLGFEGFLGLALIMGGGVAISRSVVQVPGYTSWISVADLDEALAEFVCVREAMLRYAQALIVQTMESVACNGLHSAEQRISRWLLHARDRVMSDQFTMKQQTLSETLGVRRATVSAVCAQLQKDGILEYSRGELKIIDRPRLEQRSCQCYARVTNASLLSSNRQRPASA
ncbi:Crp/Fnr family transcriptional regulator [Devosia limi]|uniref:Crp/Fnr family transcriptional regulator n=1 Tax=Devosia limi TaxID=288995 RepID=UPI001FCDB990|nr:Crp/Fnr family transcriptional regulator [Devosia limi]